MLNTRARAEAVIQAALPACVGPEWLKRRRLLGCPALLTFLDRVQEQRAALSAPPEAVKAAIQVESLRRQPEGLREEGVKAGALRGVLPAAGLVLTPSGKAGERALAEVRQLLDGAWRANSLVECINSVARMQQSRHRRMTQALLHLKRLYWNRRVFRQGERIKLIPILCPGWIITRKNLILFAQRLVTLPHKGEGTRHSSPKPESRQDGPNRLTTIAHGQQSQVVAALPRMVSVLFPPNSELNPRANCLWHSSLLVQHGASNSRRGIVGT